MFAVLKTGGKQYKVSQNDVIIVEKLSAKAGDIVQFDKILMIGDEKVNVGVPSIEGAAVQAEVLQQAKGKKVTSFVKRRRKHSSKRTRGHRQNVTVLRVGKILASGAKNDGEKIEIGVSVIGANTTVEPTKKASAKAEPTKKTSAKVEATKRVTKKTQTVKDSESKVKPSTTKKT